MDQNQNHSAELYRIRTTLGWNEAAVAARVNVSPRTVSLWESGAQAMPDSRWRLFMHEVAAFVKAPADLAVVVGVAPDGAPDRQAEYPIDVVSKDSYVACVFSSDGKTGVIASHYADRTGMAQLYRVKFEVARNQQLLNTVSRWEAEPGLPMSANERHAYTLHRWFVRRTLEEELANPKIRELKDALDHATAEVAEADEASLPKKLEVQNAAIQALMREISRSSQNS